MTCVNIVFVTAPVIASVVPASGRARGGNTVTLTGTNLAHSDNDVIVSLAGVAAVNVSVQSGSRVLVVAAPAQSYGVAGAVVVNSTRFGNAAAAGAYTYNARTFVVCPSVVNFP